MERTELALINSIRVLVKAHETTIQDHSIRYVVAGKGKPLLLLHGGNIGWGQWHPNIAALAQKHQVYALDLPGAGRSSLIDYGQLDTERHFIDVVDEFIKKVIKKKTSIVGSSIGGWIGLKLALRGRALDKLVLADAVGFMDYSKVGDRVIGVYPFAKLLSKTVLKPERSNKNIEKLLRGVFYHKDAKISHEFIEYFYATMKRSHNLLLISKLSSVSGMRQEFILIDQLTKISNKTQIIWGENDSLMPLDVNRLNFSKIKRSKVHIIKDAGHIPSIEKAKEFNRVVLTFLS